MRERLLPYLALALCQAALPARAEEPASATRLDVEDRVAQAVVHVVDGDLQEALVDFEAAAEVLPGDPEISFNRAWVLNRLRRYGAALELVQELCEKHPDYPGAKLELAIALLGIGDPDRARQTIEQAKLPLQAEAALIYGIALLRLNRTSESLAPLEAAYRAEHLRPGAAYYLMLAHEGLGQSAPAAEYRRYLTNRGGALALKAEAAETGQVYEGSRRERRFWFAALGAAGRYDSNADLIVEGEPPWRAGAKGGQAAGGRFELQGEFGLRLLDTNQWRFYWTLQAGQWLMAPALATGEAGFGDAGNAGTGFLLEYHWFKLAIPVALGLEAGGEGLWVNPFGRASARGQDSFALWRADPYAGLYADFSWSGFTLSRISYTGRREFYPTEEDFGITGEDRRDNFTHQPGFLQRFFFLGRGRADVGVHLALRDSTGEYQKRSLWDFRLGAAIPLAAWLDLNLRGLLITANYPEYAGRNRRDTRAGAGAGVVFYVTDQLAVDGQADYVHGQSDVKDFGFDRIVAGLGLRYSW